MSTKIILGLLCITAVLAWTGGASVLAATPGPMVTLPSGEAVWDLTGDWEASIENYGPWARLGTYPSAQMARRLPSTTGYTDR
jgi:hypothetical protein